MPRLWRRLKATSPPAEVVREGFRLPRFLPLRLDRIPPGIDNLHIDVALGPALSGAVAAYVGALVRERVQHLWGEPVPTFSDAVVETFREMVQEHHLSAVQDARAGRRIERVQLFQLAMLKLMLGQIDTELTATRAKLEDKKDAEGQQSDASRLQLHQQVAVLGRHAAHLRYRVAHRLLRDYMQLERGGMRNLRQSVLDVAWPVAEAMLGNPLLQLGGVGRPRDFSRLYPILLGTEPDWNAHTSLVRIKTRLSIYILPTIHHAQPWQHAGLLYFFICLIYFNLLFIKSQKWSFFNQSRIIY